MKRILIIYFIVSLVIYSCPLYCLAQATGKLNVFTDLKGAEIYIDGKLAGEESVVGYVLEVGSHYLKVSYQGKTAYAKMVEITEGRTTTITSDNFVDIRTSTPSRGAVDTEAERLREYRGNAGFGLFGPSPASGLSVRWWFAKNMGLQGIVFAETQPSYADTAFGGRLLVGFPQKIFLEEVLDAYMAIGYGKYWHADNTNPANSVLDETYALSFGLEAKVGVLANALFMNQRYIVQDMEDAMVLIGQLVTLGLFNVCYTSIEIGIEQRNRYTGSAHDTIANMKINFGLHYYF